MFLYSSQASHFKPPTTSPNHGFSPVWFPLVAYIAIPYILRPLVIPISILLNNGGSLSNSRPTRSKCSNIDSLYYMQYPASVLAALAFLFFPENYYSGGRAWSSCLLLVKNNSSDYVFQRVLVKSNCKFCRVLFNIVF